MSGRGGRAPRGKSRRPELGARLVVIALTAIFVAGLVLIADGLLMKAETDRAARYGEPTRLTQQSRVAAPAEPVLNR